MSLHMVRVDPADEEEAPKEVAVTTFAITSCSSGATLFQESEVSLFETFEHRL